MNEDQNYFSDIESEQKKTFIPHQQNIEDQANTSCTPEMLCRGFCMKIKIPIFIALIIIVAVGFILTNNAIDYNYRYEFESNMSSMHLSSDVKELQEMIETQQTDIMYLYKVLVEQGMLEHMPDDILIEYQKYLPSGEEQELTTLNDIDENEK